MARTPGKDGGTRAPDPVSTRPALCAGCDPKALPGGDTTDFGAAQAPPCAGKFVRRDLTLEQVEEQALELDADLALAEGKHGFSVRWAHLKESTTLVLEIERTGRARLEGWENVPPEGWSSDPRLVCPEEWNLVLPEVQVRIATADRSVEGAFTGWLETRRRPVLYPGSFEWERDEPWWLVTGDGSSLHGSVEFAGSGEPDALRVRVAALRSDEADARGGIELSWWWYDPSQLQNDSPAWTELDPARSARPLDGCKPFDRATDPDACDPWTETGCCEQPGRRIDYVRPPEVDAGPAGGDEDAGSSR